MSSWLGSRAGAAVVCGCVLGGCGDQGDLGSAPKANSAADAVSALEVGTLDAMGVDTATAEVTAEVGAPEALTWEDAVGAADATVDDAAPADAAPADAAPADAAPADAAQADASGVTAPDSGPADATTDGPSASDAAPPCTGCLFTQPPLAPHPGGKGPYALAPAEELVYAPGGLNGNYHKMLVVRPDAAGVWPTVLFLPGKSLYEGGGFSAKLGQPYRALLDHVASHGYVVAFVRVESGLLDADHLRMADDLLLAAKALTDKVSVANPDKIAYVGHSMGAKVALLAAWKTLNSDQANEHADPAAVLLFAVANEPPPVGAYQNAMDKTKVMWKDAPTWFTFATGADDVIAAWNDPKKPNAKALFDALPTTKKQLLVVHGTGKDDPNPPTKPELVDDHSAPMTIEGKPGGIADVALTDSHLDALDWYGFWKWTVGALNAHFKGGDPAWAYGAGRTHGGDLPDGKAVQHQVVGQGWTVWPGL
jgi:hypothetical protein